MTEIDEIKIRIEALERQVGIQVKKWGWSEIIEPTQNIQPSKKKKKKKTVPQAEPAELESHPSHNWKPGNKGPRGEV
jgi:hypothetical protein